jgi:hypothetical protein
LDAITSINSSRFHKRFRALALQRRAKASTSTPAWANCSRTASQSPPSAGHDRSDLAVIGEGLQCSLRDRVHRKWSGQRLDIESIGRLWVFGASAGPQQSLRLCAGVECALRERAIQQTEVRFINTTGDGDAEPLFSPSGALPATAASQRLMKTEATELGRELINLPGKNKRRESAPFSRKRSPACFGRLL